MHTTTLAVYPTISSVLWGLNDILACSLPFKKLLVFVTPTINHMKNKCQG